MSATPRGKKQRKGPVITIDDDDSVVLQQRAGKVVKAEPEPDQQIVELEKKLVESTAKNEKLTRIAGAILSDKDQLKERVGVLETTIDSKAGILDGAKQKQDELKNQLSRKEQHVEALVKQGAAVKDEVLEDRNRILALENDNLKEKKKNEELEKKLIDLTNQREDERRLWSEERKRDQDRIKSLTAKLEEVSSLNSQQNQSIDHRQMEELHEYDDANDDMNSMAHVMIGERVEKGTGDKRDDVAKNSTKSEEVEKRRRSSRNRSVKNADSMEESDEEDEPSMKKKRFESVEKKGKGIPQKRRSDSESSKEDMEKNKLECPVCEYRSESVCAWQSHLRNLHSTTPVLAGCLLRCDCGNESYSDKHSRKCDISNFTIVRIGDGTIRRLTDPVTTPQCVLCKKYPTSVRGYAKHLAIHHKSTLKANGIYLKCACGDKCTSNRHVHHDKKCDGRNYTLHKLEED